MEKNFNPRTPYGMRRLTNFNKDSRGKFQSTHPLRDATKLCENGFYVNVISIHAPLTGCDKKKMLIGQKYIYFNPRTPYGMRLTSISINNVDNDFNPRTPYGMRHG